MWNALIRTHHITSRKKITKLKQVAEANDVYVLLRGGSPPGVMYVEGQEKGVRAWVEVVQKLRYKDYQLVAKPSIISRETTTESSTPLAKVGVSEEESVKGFGQQMQHRGVYDWWRAAMGYIGQDGRL